MAERTRLQDISIDIAKQLEDCAKRIRRAAKAPRYNLELGMEVVTEIRNLHSNVRLELLVKYSAADEENR